MKIKLLISRADATGAQNRGDVVDVSPEEAKRMVDAGQAEIVRSAAPEKAVKRSKAEKAVR
jgi:hypothetical protein